MFSLEYVFTDLSVQALQSGKPLNRIRWQSAHEAIVSAIGAQAPICFRRVTRFIEMCPVCRIPASKTGIMWKMETTVGNDANMLCPI
jgi:hypothetical protein